ncbi:MAG: PrsW family intramembrane metalloprotease [Minisyncoccia bacterium]
MVIVISIIALTFLSLLPGFAWLIIFLHEDIHPEPKYYLLKTFGIGIGIALPVYGLETLFNFITKQLHFSPLLFLVFVLALIEELSKFIAAKIAVYKNKNFDEPVDAMIYTITAALGFATIENLISASGYAVDLNYAIKFLSLRFAGATMLHALTGGFIGYFWGKSIQSKKQINIFYGLIIAIILHFIFNSLIILLQPNQLLYAEMILLMASFFVFYDFEKLQKGETIQTSKNN